MSDGKLPVLHQRHRCVHHYRRQTATTGGNWPVTKDGILRQVRGRLWPLFAASISGIFSDRYHRKGMVSLCKTIFPMLRFIIISRLA
jgi:hypothetical protein